MIQISKIKLFFFISKIIFEKISNTFMWRLWNIESTISAF